MKIKRNTVAKTTILQLLTQSEVALSHLEIQKMTVGVCDRVTIYRVLERLIIEDLIHKIATREGTIKYASCNHKHKSDAHTHNHIHFNCEKCMSVTCLENVEPIFTIPNTYLIKDVNFTISGFCPNCV